jgi:hypothetical protein
MRWILFAILIGLSMKAHAFDVETLDVHLSVKERPKPVRLDSQRVFVTLIPEAGMGTHVVSFALPFPPDVLFEHMVIRALNDTGKEVPIFTKPLAHWQGRDHSGLRSVLVQFEMTFADTMAQTWTLVWDETRVLPRKVEVPTSETQFVRDDEDASYYCPKVLALLSPDWLCNSWVAWQQVAASKNEVATWYDDHVLGQFDGSLININSETYAPHLYDRPATYAKIYVRHGQREHLLAALKAGAVYMSHLGADGFFDLKPKDYKYVYAEGVALLYLLTGDTRFKEAALLTLSAWDQWQSFRYGGEGFWTERHVAFGMAAYLHVYELTGHVRLLDLAKAYFDGVYALQTQPLDGKDPDGAWRHTAESHGDGIGWTTSPWMSALLMDSIWKYWILTGDDRAPISLALYAKFISTYGITPDGKGVYYMAASPGVGKCVNPENPPHHVEACYMLAMGYFLSGGKDLELWEKYQRLWPLVMGDDANRPPRKFSWRFRNTSMLVWFLDGENR